MSVSLSLSSHALCPLASAREALEGEPLEADGVTLQKRRGLGVRVPVTVEGVKLEGTTVEGVRLQGTTVTHGTAAGTVTHMAP